MKPWCDPVVGLHHRARNPGVTRLIGSDEPEHTKVAEVADVERGTAEHNPGNLGGPAGAGRFGFGRAWFRHRNLSLTLKYFLLPPNLLHTVAQ